MRSHLLDALSPLDPPHGISDVRRSGGMADHVGIVVAERIKSVELMHRSGRAEVRRLEFANAFPTAAACKAALTIVAHPA